MGGRRSLCEAEEQECKRSRVVGPGMEATSTQIDAESLLGAAEGLTRMVTHGSDYSGLAGTSEGKEQRDALDESMPDKPAPFLKKLALMLRTNEYSQLVRWDGLNEERGTQMFVVLDAVCPYPTTPPNAWHRADPTLTPHLDRHALTLPTLTAAG